MDSELMMFYNVENFFPPDDPSQATPLSGLYHWDDYKYRLKVRKITRVFQSIQEDYRQLPCMIGLAEIGAGSVLQDLTAGESPISHYRTLYRSSPDARGLSVALLFDPARLHLHTFRTLQFCEQEDTAVSTRDVLHAEFMFHLQKLHVFVLHLPSQRDRDAKRMQRLHILEQLDQTVKSLLTDGDAVIVMGDFNDNPDAEAILNLSATDGSRLGLQNPFLELFSAKQFSSYHGKKGVCFDQILYSDNTVVPLQAFGFAHGIIYRPAMLCARDQKNSQYPSRTYSGSRYMGGYSDHFPVLLELRNSQK